MEYGNRGYSDQKRLCGQKTGTSFTGYSKRNGGENTGSGKNSEKDIEKDDLLARHIFIVLQIYLRERTEPAGIYILETTEPEGVGRIGRRRFV